MDHIERDQFLKRNTTGNILSDLFDSFREAKTNDEPEEQDKILFCPLCGERMLITKNEIANNFCFLCDLKKRHPRNVEKGYVV